MKRRRDYEAIERTQQPSRRQALRGAAALIGLGMTAPFVAARAQPREADAVSIELRRLVAANRVLANEGVVDAFGHVSVRHPRDADRYVMARSRSPALIELDDLMEFELDGTPLDPRGRTPYGERMIHGAIYEARTDVRSVVHNHAYSVLPFAVSGSPLRPVIHTASIIGAEIPVWDIRDVFGETDMLVRTMEMGRSLAATLGRNTCLLMRGHGAVVAAPGVREAVLTAVYLQVNAEVQLTARGLGETRVLSEREIALSAATQFSPLALDRAWEYFCARAGVDPV